jgi:hypothetical protein
MEFDCTLQTIHAKGSKGFGSAPHKLACRPVDLNLEITDLVSRLTGTPASRLRLCSLDGKHAKEPKKLLDSQLPGHCFRLPYRGDQRHYLYIGKADQEGEFPILGLEAEIGASTGGGQVQCLIAAFVKYPSFDTYLADITETLDLDRLRPRMRRRLKTQMHAARKLHPEIKDEAKY